MTNEEFCSKYCVERLGTNCVKWDRLEEDFGNKDLIAMWVADMEFKVPDEVINELKKRIDHGVFGYSYIQESYYETFSSWQERQHNCKIESKWLRFSAGVVSALYSAIYSFTDKNDSVIINTPVYFPFANAVRQTNRNLIQNELVNTNGSYTIDYSKFEKDIMDHNVKLFILCSPHNPVGRVWKEEELQKVFSICKKHKVLIISDEIHQDIIFEGNKQISAINVENAEYIDDIVAVTSASKTFNIAGLAHSHVIIPNEELRIKYDKYIQSVCHDSVNLLSVVATEAAYKYGDVWLKQLLNVIWENYCYAKEAFAKLAPKIVVSPLEGTYLMWLDLRGYLGTEGLKEFVQEKCGIAVNYGEWFGEKSKGFIRLNLATDPCNVKKTVEKLLNNLVKYL